MQFCFTIQLCLNFRGFFPPLQLIAFTTSNLNGKFIETENSVIIYSASCCWKVRWGSVVNFIIISSNFSYHFGASGLPPTPTKYVWSHFMFYRFVYFTWPDLKTGPRPFSRSGECSHAVKLQKSLLVYKTSPSTWAWAENWWIFIFGWTYPLKQRISWPGAHHQEQLMEQKSWWRTITFFNYVQFCRKSVELSHLIFGNTIV